MPKVSLRRPCSAPQPQVSPQSPAFPHHMTTESAGKTVCRDQALARKPTWFHFRISFRVRGDHGTLELSWAFGGGGVG